MEKVEKWRMQKMKYAKNMSSFPFIQIELKYCMNMNRPLRAYVWCISQMIYFIRRENVCLSLHDDMINQSKVSTLEICRPHCCRTRRKYPYKLCLQFVAEKRWLCGTSALRRSHQNWIKRIVLNWDYHINICQMLETSINCKIRVRAFTTNERCAKWSFNILFWCV